MLRKKRQSTYRGKIKSKLNIYIFVYKTSVTIIWIFRRAKEPKISQNDKSIDDVDSPRKKSSCGKKKIFYRVVKGRKVSYEFNATYRTPSDSEWVSEIQIRPKSENESTRKKSKSEQSDSETEPEQQEEFDMFDIATAKLMSKQLQK